MNGAIFTVRETYFESRTGMRQDGGTNERQTDIVYQIPSGRAVLCRNCCDCDAALWHTLLWKV